MPKLVFIAPHLYVSEVSKSFRRLKQWLNERPVSVKSESMSKRTKTKKRQLKRKQTLTTPKLKANESRSEAVFSVRVPKRVVREIKVLANSHELSQGKFIESLLAFAR